jgi:hypothetical protein
MPEVGDLEWLPSQVGEAERDRQRLQPRPLAARADSRAAAAAAPSLYPIRGRCSLQ